MPAYLVANVDVHDPQQYAAYQELVGATIEKFGGRPVVRGGHVEHLEGHFDAKRVVVVEFPSMERARAWWASDEYARVKPLRASAATATMVLLDGV